MASVETIHLKGVKRGSAATSGRGVALMRTIPGPEVPVLPSTDFFDTLFLVEPDVPIGLVFVRVTRDPMRTSGPTVLIDREFAG